MILFLSHKSHNEPSGSFFCFNGKSYYPAMKKGSGSLHPLPFHFLYECYMHFI